MIKSKLTLTLVLLFHCFTVSNVWGDECGTVPGFVKFGASNGQSLTTMRCFPDGADMSNIECSFSQFFISRRAITDGFFLSAKALLENSDDELLKVVCKDDTPEQKASFAKAVEWATNTRTLTEQRRKAELLKNNGCLSRDAKTVRSALAADAALDERTCHIDINDFKESFRRVSPRKFLSTDGPRGLCGIVVVSSVECGPETGSFWQFRTAVVEMTGDKSDPLCKNTRLNNPVTIGFKELGTLTLSCDYID
jgi:hypothetical protein